MDVTTFGSRSNVRQICCYICPGRKDVKCVTDNVIIFVPDKRQDKYCLNMKPYFIQGQILDKIDKCVALHDRKQVKNDVTKVHSLTLTFLDASL